MPPLHRHVWSKMRFQTSLSQCLPSTPCPQPWLSPDIHTPLIQPFSCASHSSLCENSLNYSHVCTTVKPSGGKAVFFKTPGYFPCDFFSLTVLPQRELTPTLESEQCMLVLPSCVRHRTCNFLRHATGLLLPWLQTGWWVFLCRERKQWWPSCLSLGFNFLMVRC